jgi:hypothetical protein
LRSHVERYALCAHRTATWSRALPTRPTGASASPSIAVALRAPSDPC